MSRDYAEERIREALARHGGNAARARQQVIAWAAEDSKLLRALAGPHLTGIVAYNVDRVLSGRAEPKRRAVPKAPPGQKRGERFGMEILKAAASSNAAVFGQESNAAPAKRGKASQAHIDALRKMAGKDRPKKS